MKKKTSSWLAALVLATLVIAGAVLINLRSYLPSQPKEAKTTILAETTLAFAVIPPAKAGSVVSVPVQIDTGQNTVSAVQLVINYDPKVLENVSLSVGQFLPQVTVLQNKIDVDKGVVNYALGSLRPQKGNGELVVFRARVKSSAPKQTEITLGEGTEAAAIGERGNVLKATRKAVLAIIP